MIDSDDKSRSGYIEEIQQHLRAKDKRYALVIVREAMRCFPDDPILLSYSGYLIADVERRKSEGIKICQEAIKLLRKSKSPDRLFLLPFLNLNLGRTYLRSKNKKAALKAFHEGLKYDPKNRELLSEMEDFEKRKRPVLSFMNRENTLNKYLGKLRHMFKSKK